MGCFVGSFKGSFHDSFKGTLRKPPTFGGLSPPRALANRHGPLPGEAAAPLNASRRAGSGSWHAGAGKGPLKGVLIGLLKGILKGIYKSSIIGGSWDLVSKVISTVSVVVSNYKYSYLTYIPSY